MSSFSFQETRKIAKNLVALQVLLISLLLPSLGGLSILYPDGIRVSATIHGIAAITSTVLGSYLGHQSIALIRGSCVNAHLLRWLTSLFAVLYGGAVVSGNWLYINYHSFGTLDVQKWMMHRSFLVYQSLMDCKPMIALFPLPLSVVGAFLLWQWQPDDIQSRDFSVAAGCVLSLAWLFLIASLILGLDMTKIRLAFLFEQFT